MSSFVENIIAVISKPIENRQDHEIDSILFWFINLFKKKAAVFGDIETDVIKDIVKNCSFETRLRDEIIIRQGDLGDCFYINLHGKVSVYIDHKQHDAHDSNTDGIHSQESSVREDVVSNENKSGNLRQKLGTYVTTLQTGEGFGEIALVSDDYRSASIITDETTNLIVINKALYTRCLKAPTLRKLVEKQNFINKSQFFSNWSLRMKKFLVLSLERDIIPHDSFLGKQGEIADKIYFIISGQVKVIVDPIMHQSQYPHLGPLITNHNERKDTLISLMNNSLKNKKHSLPENQHKNSHPMMRRKCTFAEAEQRLKNRNIEVGILGPGEITGMCEIILDIPTYMQSVKCIEDCDVFYLYKRNYERLIAKRNPMCINKMKEYVYTKLKARNTRLNLINPIPLYQNLELKLEEQIINKNRLSKSVERKSANDGCGGRASLRLPPRGTIVQMDVRVKKAKKQKAKTLPANHFLQLNESTQDVDEDYFSSSSNANDSQENLNKDLNMFIDEEKKKVIESEASNDKALDELEDRIKKWHIDNGTQKPLISKFNRIQIEKVKATDIKVGGQIYIKKRKKTVDEIAAQQHNQEHRGSGSSGVSSNSGDANDSDDDYNAYDINKSIANFLRIFGTDKTYERTQNLKSNRPSITSDFDDSSSKLFLNRPRLSLPLTNDIEDKLKVKRNSLPTKLTTTNTSENDVKSRKVSFTSSTNGSTISKRRNSSINFQFSPYIFRKLSMSELKVNHGGKTYSKEEYLALKEKLKHQSRRYSGSSILSS